MTGRRALVGLGLAWVLAVLLAPLVGSHPVDLEAAFRGTGPDATILWHLRLPRVLLALAAGGILALAGVGFQAVFHNPLAEPYTLGVASGAALGASLSFLLAGPGATFVLVAASSFVGALGATALVVALGGVRGGLDPVRVLLAGVAIALSCQAVILFSQYLAAPNETLRMIRWMMGGLGTAGYGETLWLVPWLGGAAAVFVGLRWELDLLHLGDEVAASRGVHLRRLRLSVLVVGSTTVAALVAVAGPIGFVGLMVPHMLRRIVGVDHHRLVPAALLGGGVFLVVCDTASRVVLAPAELPVGIVTALLGGPFFLWLLLRSPERGSGA